MTAFTRVQRALGVATLGALLLTACGNDDDMSGMDHGSGGSSNSKADSNKADSSGTFNDADVTFAQMMVPHHQQALEMAELADGRASDAQLKDIVAKIEKAQEPEIRTLTGWLKSWKQPTAMEHTMPGMMPGMMSAKDMDELTAMKGAEFDKMFAEMMIDHHNGAISMAKDEQKNGKHADAMKMAGDIATGQSAEVKQLQGILDRL